MKRHIALQAFAVALFWPAAAYTQATQTPAQTDKSEKLTKTEAPSQTSDKDDKKATLTVSCTGRSLSKIRWSFSVENDDDPKPIKLIADGVLEDDTLRIHIDASDLHVLSPQQAIAFADAARLMVNRDVSVSAQFCDLLGDKREPEPKDPKLEINYKWEKDPSPIPPPK